MRKVNLKTQKFVKILFISSIATFSLSVIFKLALCGNMVIKNSELEAAFQEREVLKEKISKLSFIDSNLSSINLVENKAKKLGFVEMTGRVLSLNVNEPAQVAVLNH